MIIMISKKLPKYMTVVLLAGGIVPLSLCLHSDMCLVVLSNLWIISMSCGV